MWVATPRSLLPLPPLWVEEIRERLLESKKEQFLVLQIVLYIIGAHINLRAFKNMVKQKGFTL